MKKCMYSLMLSEDIINEIDKLAYKNQTNRSNMINTILADHINFKTPEMRLNDMFSKIENMMISNDNMQVLLRNSNTIMNIRSALQFRYNPSLKYTIELYSSYFNNIGELRVNLRTQNSVLSLYLIQFYKLWIKIEDKYLAGSEYELSNEKFIKKFILKKTAQTSQYTEEEISRGIVEYINAFDRALKAFFYNSDSPSRAILEVESVYTEYMTNASLRF